MNLSSSWALKKHEQKRTWRLGAEAYAPAYAKRCVAPASLLLDIIASDAKYRFATDVLLLKSMKRLLHGLQEKVSDIVSLALGTRTTVLVGGLCFFLLNIGFDFQTFEF